MIDQNFVDYIQALQEEDNLLKVNDVAALVRVDPKTVSRWAKWGWLPSIKTPGGHYRFRPSVLAKFLDEGVMIPNSGRFPREGA